MIVLRGGTAGAGPLEVLLLRRHASMRTFRNLWVFPGGQHDAADGDLRLTACRETFEEAGILLARRADGGAPESEQRARIRARRAEFTRDPAAFFAAMASESLVFDPAALARWSRWVTPSVAPRSFDTAFFVAVLPAEAAVELDTDESNEARWVEPGTVRASHEDPRLPLAPPTILSLIEIAAAAGPAGDVTAVLRSAATRRIVPIQPKVACENGAVWAVFPWDPDFESLAGASMSRADDVPDHLRRLPSRLLASAEVRLPGTS